MVSLSAKLFFRVVFDDNDKMSPLSASIIRWPVSRSTIVWESCGEIEPTAVGPVESGLN